MVEITPGALKHGVDPDDIRHALRYFVRVTHTADPHVTMHIGPSRTGALLEVGLVNTEDRSAVVHAMPARHKFLPRRGRR